MDLFSASPHLEATMTPSFNCLQGPVIALGHFFCPYQVPRGHAAMGLLPEGSPPTLPTFCLLWLPPSFAEANN